MRLAVVSPFVDRRHGTERALAELLERLAYSYGCEIHLYAQCVEDLALSDPKTTPSPHSGSISWHSVPSIPGPHVLKFLVWVFLNGFLRWSHTFFRKISFDLVLSPGINCFHADVVIVHVLFHRLQQLSSEGKSLLVSTQPSFYRSLHRRIYYALLSRLERRVYTDSNVSIAAVSRRIEDLLIQYFGRHDVRVIPNGVDTAHFSPAMRLARRSKVRSRLAFRDDDFVLLLIGNDWGMKGLPMVLEALAVLRGVPIQLLVVGTDDVEPFRAAAARLGVQNCCHWKTPTSDVLDFYSASDLYVSPSREDSFGLPVAEAMACGLPVITSVFAGVASLIQNGVNGFVLEDPFDIQALSRLIQLLYLDPELQRRIGSAAAKVTQDWTWDRNAEAVWKLLTDLTAHKFASQV